MHSKNIMIKVIFLIMSLSFFLKAQEKGIVEGWITDKKTKEPLIGANVEVLGTSLGAATDLDGMFVIANVPVGTQRLKFSFIGYEEVILSDIAVTPSKVVILNIELKPQAFSSEEILVTAGYFTDETAVQPSTLRLSREEIRRFPGGFEDVVRTVSTLPGVAINFSGGRNDLLVRGGGPSENLYIVNNIAVPNINHFGTQGSSSGSLSFINLDFVENVSFSTGGFSVRYGDKMSSVLNLDLAQGRNDRFGGKVLISATQYGLNAEGPIGEKANFIFSARQSYLDLIFKAAKLPFVPSYTDFNFLYNRRFDNGAKLSFISFTALDRVDRDQSTIKNRKTNAGIMDNSQNQYINGVNYELPLSHGYIDLTANFNLNQYRFSQIDEFETEYFKSESDEIELGLKASHFWAISKQIGLLSGLSFKNIQTQNKTEFADTIIDRNGNRVARSDIGVGQLSEQDISAGKAAAFIEAEWFPVEKLTVSLGARLEHYGFLETKNYLAPRLAINYDFTERFSIKGSVGRYYQAPSYIWVSNPVNKRLKAFFNDMYITGLSYLLKEDTRTSLEFFYKDYNNLATGTVTGINDYLVITNTGTGFGGREDDFNSFGFFPMVSEGYGEAYGFEFLVQKRFSDTPFYGQFSFSYTKSEYTALNGNTYPGQFDQRYIINLAGGYIFNEKWEISGKARYFTGVPYTPVYIPSENPVNPGIVQNLPEEYLSERTDDSYVLDLRADRFFYFNRLKLTVFLDIQNVLNFKIAQRPRYDFAEKEIVDSSEIGILPSIGISLEF